MTIDSAGDVLGTTSSGEPGVNGNGTVWEVPPGQSKIDLIENLASSSLFLSDPVSALIPDGGGNFFGMTGGNSYLTARAGGAEGALFELTAGGSITSVTGLSPTFDSSSLPASVISGIKTTGALSVTLANTADATEKVASIGVYASTDGSIDSSSTLVETITSKKTSLKAGKTAKLSLPVKTITAPAGTYTLLTQITDAAGDVLGTSTGPSVVVQAAVVTYSTTLAAPAVTTVKPGKSVMMTLELTDTGNVPVAGPYSFAYGLSIDGSTLPVAALALQKSLQIKPGKIAKVKLKYVFADTLAAGNYFPEVTVTTPTGSIAVFSTVAIVDN